MSDLNRLNQQFCLMIRRFQAFQAMDVNGQWFRNLTDQWLGDSIQHFQRRKSLVLRIARFLVGVGVREPEMGFNGNTKRFSNAFNCYSRQLSHYARHAAKMGKHCQRASCCG